MARLAFGHRTCSMPREHYAKRVLIGICRRVMTYQYPKALISGRRRFLPLFSLFGTRHGKRQCDVSGHKVFLASECVGRNRACRVESHELACAESSLPNIVADPIVTLRPSDIGMPGPLREVSEQCRKVA